MNSSTPRLRMFAGPNGSGKSTLKTVLPKELLGVYLNPDELEVCIRTTGSISIEEYGVEIDSKTDESITEFFRQSKFLQS